jgi:hypothetical protein
MSASRRVLILVPAGLVTALLLAAAFRGLLLAPLIVAVLERSLGIHATIGGVGGTVVGGLELRKLSARGAAGAGPLASFDAERVGARYNLAALLRGTGAFLDSLELTVEGARADIDLAGPAGGASRPATPAAPLTPPSSALPRLPRLTVRDSRVSVRGSAYTLEAGGIQGTVARADGAHGQAVDLRIARFSLRHPALREETLALAIAGSYAPRSLAITAAQVNGEPLVERARLDLGEQPGDLDLQLALRLWQGAIEVGVTRRATGVEVRWDARGLDLQPQALLVNPALAALRGKLSTAGGVKLGSAGIPTLAGTLSLDWQGALFAGRAVDRLLLECSAESGVVLVKRAEGHVGPNEVRLLGVTLPAGPLFEGRWRALLSGTSGSFSGSLGDVPAFLAFWGVDAGRAAAAPAHRLRVEGSLEKGRLQLARSDLATGLGKATLTALTLDLPREDQGWGETAFSGRAAVDLPSLRDVSALFPMPPLGGSLRGEVSGKGTFERPEGRATLAGRSISVAGRSIGDVDLRARGAAGRVEIEALEVRQGGSRFTARGDIRLPAAGLGTSDSGAILDGLAGSFALSSSDLPGLAAMAGVPPEQVARIPAAHLLTVAGAVRERAVTVTSASFAAAGGTVTLREARVAMPPRGADWRTGATFAGELEVDLPDLAPIAPILGMPTLQGSLRGKAHIAGTADAPGGSVTATGRGIAVAGHRVGDVVVTATAQRQGVRIEALEVTRGGDRLRGSGAYDLKNGVLLEAEAEISLADVAPYVAEFAPPGGAPVSGRFHGSVRASGPLQREPLVVEAEFSEARGGRVEGARGTVKAQVTFPGALREPRFTLAVQVTEARGGVAGHPLRASLDASYEPGLLRVGAFEITGSGGLAVRGEGTVPLDLAATELLGPGPLSLRAKADVPALEELAFLFPAGYAVTGSLRTDVALTGSWKEPAARVEVRGERLQPPPGTRFAPPGPFSLAGTLAWSAAEARVEEVRLASPALSCSLSGAWSSPPPLAALLAGGHGAASGSLALRASVSLPDIAWLRGSVEGLRGVRGSVEGELSVDGPPGDPVLSGEIRVLEVALRYRDLPPIDALSATASVARRSVTLTKVGGNVGGSPFTLSGSLELTRLDDPVLDLRLRGTNALLYRDEGLRLRADTDLTLRGPWSALALAGEVALTDSLFQKSFSIARLFSGGGKADTRPTPGLSGISFPEPPLRDMRFDVHLTAHEPFRVLTSVLRAAARPDLRLTGTGLLPLLSGPILVEAARVKLPSGTLELERGTVLFRVGAPGRPQLDFGGRMQLRGYEITVQIGGTLEAPEVTLSSSPPLPQQELLLFVLTGAPPGSSTTASGTATAVASPMAVYLGMNALEGLLGGGSTDVGADLQSRLELQVGREMTRNGSPTVDARLLLKKDPGTLGRSVYLTSEKDIYDQDNFGLRVVFKFR